VIERTLVIQASTVDAALKGRTVVIPGFVNQVVQVSGALVPASLMVHLIGKRWKKAHYEIKAEGGTGKTDTRCGGARINTLLW
jgi:hypothetical protein